MNHAAIKFAKENHVQDIRVDKTDTIDTIYEKVRGMTDTEIRHAIFCAVDWDLHSVEPTWDRAYPLSELNFLLSMLELEKVKPDMARDAYFIHLLQDEFMYRFVGKAATGDGLFGVE